MKDFEIRPFVSVVIPAYNAERSVEGLMLALDRQTYPKDRYEVILIDNASRDRTMEKAKALAARLGCRVAVESETAIQSSYAARNKGLSLAGGDVLAFVDTDCLPDAQWIEKGVETLREEKADLAGGFVRFTYRTDKPSAIELVDSRHNMQMERDIRTRGVAKTANLFVRREVFDRVGPFPSKVRSGGDVQWTWAATSAGHKLVFAPEAEVAHPARGWIEAFKKQIRVGKGQIPAMRRAGLSWVDIMKDCLKVRASQDVSLEPGKIIKQDKYRKSPTRMAFAKIWSRMGSLFGRMAYAVQPWDWKHDN